MCCQSLLLNHDGLQKAVAPWKTTETLAWPDGDCSVHICQSVTLIQQENLSFKAVVRRAFLRKTDVPAALISDSRNWLKTRMILV